MVTMALDARYNGSVQTGRAWEQTSISDQWMPPEHDRNRAPKRDCLVHSVCERMVRTRKRGAQHWLTTLQRSIDRHHLVFRPSNRVLEQPGIAANDLRAGLSVHLRPSNI